MLPLVKHQWKAQLLILNKEITKQDLIKIKQQTTEIERLFSRKGKTNLEERQKPFDKEFSINQKRTINLDPGYLNDKELVLASFKKGTNYKEDLGEGVYAHKVLEFKEKPIIFWHTFPDYRVKENQEFFISNVNN